MNRTMSANANALRQAPHVSVSVTPGVGEPPPSAALSASAKHRKDHTFLVNIRIIIDLKSS